jgi:predicted site-specific integrase-resolvase
MKSKDVLRLMKITRQTLCKYVKNKSIRIEVQPNGQYNYNESDVYKFLNKDLNRKIVIYSRVSTHKQKNDLENQSKMLKQYCFSKGYQVFEVFEDIASGINFDKRKQFFKLVDGIIDGKIEKVVVLYKDRLSRVGFSLFVELFKRFDCEIEVMSEVGNTKLDSEEVFEEIVSMLHCYSMKMYSNRRSKTKLEISSEK